MAVFALLAGLLALPCAPDSARAGPRPPSGWSSNRYTGLAIEGFDPVAYFTDARPCRACREFEALEAGAVWRFRNEGNRASFVAHPEIYGPQFGGYDPVDRRPRRDRAGNPRFWLIADQRLYLFGREENRDAFAADPGALLRRGERALAGAASRTWRSSVSAQRAAARIAPGDEFRHDEIRRVRAPKLQRRPAANP